MEPYSAGILPYSFHNGRVVWLLGRESRRNVWSDFGGHNEYRDKGDPINTASREFFEETLGSIMSVRDVKDVIKDPKTHEVKSSTMMGNIYTMYLVYIPYDTLYRTAFNKTRLYMNYMRFLGRFIEKNDIRWFDHGKLFKKENPLRYRLCFYNTLTNNKEVFDDILKTMTRSRN